MVSALAFSLSSWRDFVHKCFCGLAGSEFPCLAAGLLNPASYAGCMYLAFKFSNAVKLLLWGHPRDIPKCPVNRESVLLIVVCKNICAIFVNDSHSRVTLMTITAHWSHLEPKIEHWQLNVQNWSPAGNLCFVQ